MSILIKDMEIPSDILQKAVKNTVQMCIDAVEVTE